MDDGRYGVHLCKTLTEKLGSGYMRVKVDIELHVGDQVGIL
jgi:hypothetical protein